MRAHSNPRIEVAADPDAISQRAIELIVDEMQGAIFERKRFSLALSGGETPKRLYETLANPPYGNRLPWGMMHLFFVDERCVPPDSPQSNFNMVWDTLISRIRIPSSNIHRIHCEGDATQAAQEYEKQLQRFFRKRDSLPEFDFTLLGLGTNGHTASLFPNTPVLNESKKWVVGYYVQEIDMSRVTLTLPVINHSKKIVFFVSGQKKADIVKQVVEGPHEPEKWPAQFIKPDHGTLLWLLDRPAASRLGKKPE